MSLVVIDGLSFALPLFIIAVGGIYSERSGVTNLALEGLLGFGAFTGGLFVVLTSGIFPQGSQTPICLSFLFAAIGGGAYSLIHATLCVKFRANQVMSGIAVNILAVALTGFFTYQVNAGVFGSPSDKFMIGVSPRVTAPGISDIPVLGAFFTNVYPFEIMILAIAAFCWYVLYRTRYGIRLRACGDNPQAVDAAGISVAKARFGAVAISGALSGVGGMCFAYSITANFSPAIYLGAGYLAIAALIFGNWKMIPALGACLIFGFARSAAYQVAKSLEISSNVSDLAMSLPYVLTLLLLAFFSKGNRAPRALGEIYDKGKR
ncbi:MAG: ABC transporter permease [Clostridiales Family XIII bacterium]|jgi:simple sugar transport system permease protein|nr:ABC transporter permease [Clostridiales Family XIII bacterium]